MSPISSVNNNLNTLSEEDLYYPLGDVILFKNYNKFFGKPKTPNMFCNVPMPEIDNTINNKNLGPSITEEFTNLISNQKLSTLFKDNKFDNYRQPGIQGLKIFIKNGKKPVSFTLQSIIKGVDAQHLYIWEPIPPQDFIALGHYCTLGKNPPDIDKCNIRCLPKSCCEISQVNAVDIIQSNGIEEPYGVYLSSEGKYFKGITLLPGQEIPILKSHNIHNDCKNIEINKELEDKSNIMLTYKNINEETKNKTFNSIEIEIRQKVEEFLINTQEFKLNNSRNVQENELEELLNKRFKISGGELKNDTSIVVIELEHHSEVYNEISNEQLTKELYKFINVNTLNIGNEQEYWELLLTEVSGYASSKTLIKGNAFKDPELLKDTETAKKLLRGRFDDDIYISKLQGGKNESDLNDFINLESLTKPN